MRIITWLIRIVLFFLLLAFAIKNDQFVDLNFFINQTWQLPLVFIILGAFLLGTLFGITATAASLLSKRREIARLKKKNALQKA